MTALLVALGAAAGAPLRYLTDRWIQNRFGTRFPWGTLVVNLAGSLVLGFLAALPAASALMAFAGVGFCGALTTYSTFSYETLRLYQEGSRVAALAYAGVSVTGGFGVVFAGVALAHTFSG
ncbi:fluoride efflux transporter CrcB [Micromonospora sp. NPDC004704]